MKWYFACNDKSEEFFPLIKGAVASALQNTTLNPYFIYDGVENELTAWLRKKGVNIINHKVSFYNELEDAYCNNAKGLAVASGAFLRCDIPIIEQEDDFVLYTDCDVLFLKDFDLDLKPEYFACAPQTNKKNYRHFNSGVMLMNVKKLRENHKNFSDFIRKNCLNLLDQPAYQIFYDSKVTKLPIIYNHKPYWEVDENAVILHFHGAKPTTFALDAELQNFCYSYLKLYEKNPNAYNFYLEVFKKYYPEIQYCYDGISKLKMGIYPLNKTSGNSFFVKIKNRLIKEYKVFIRKFFCYN